MAQTQQVTRNDSRNNNRKKRIPFGVARKKLEPDKATLSRYKSEGKVLRWIKEEDTRLQSAEEGGYEFVMAQGEENIGGKQQEGDRRIRKLGNRSGKSGEPQYLYLMAIPKEYYEEDQKAKERVNQLVDEAIQGGKPVGLQEHGINPEQGRTYTKNIDYQP